MNLNEILVGVAAIIVPIFTYLSTRDRKDRVALAEMDANDDFISELLRWIRHARTLLDQAGIDYQPVPRRKSTVKQKQVESTEPEQSS